MNMKECDSAKRKENTGFVIANTIKQKELRDPLAVLQMCEVSSKNVGKEITNGNIVL